LSAWVDCRQANRKLDRRDYDAGFIVFGLVNDACTGPDHVAHIDPQWRVLFAASALILAVIELIGSGLAFICAREK
jgi:hypothetical protein